MPTNDRPTEREAGCSAEPTQEPADTGGTTRHRKPEEIGGTAGPEPTRYGDWEKNGRCIDF